MSSCLHDCLPKLSQALSVASENAVRMAEYSTQNADVLRLLQALSADVRELRRAVDELFAVVMEAEDTDGEE